MAKRSKKGKKAASNGAFGGAKKSAQVSMSQSKQDIIMEIIQEQMGALEFDSDEAAQAYLEETFLSRPMDDVLAEYRGDQAQQIDRLLALAKREDKPADAKKLIRQALKIDPDCFGAKVLMTFTHSSLEKSADELAVINEEESLKLKSNIEEAKQKGLDLWLFPNCRPWLDAQFQLAKILEMMHEYDRAIDVLEVIIGLNPGDNLRIQSNLVIDCMITGKWDAAISLLDKDEDKGCELMF